MEFPDFGGHCKRKEGEGPNKMRLSSLINFKLYIFFLMNLNYIFINYYNNGLLNSNSTNPVVQFKYRTIKT